jgi:hypothetical protein
VTGHFRVALAGVAHINTSGHLLAGSLCVTAGALLAAGGLALGRDYKGLGQRFYGRVVKEWDRVPVAGRLYRRALPFGRFKISGCIAALVMGLILCLVGVGSFVTM